MAELTPMMQQYMETKEQYRDCILFYRLGDFYEMFFEDAKLVSKELELTLTGKSCGLEERAPMCGVPYHAADGYINKLIAKGYKVAVCEQVEDPKEAKNLVRREVVRIVTPGTNLDPGGLDESRNNFILGIFYINGRFGVAAADITTAEFLVTEADSTRRLMDELYKYNPAEIVCNESFFMSGIDTEELKNRFSVCISTLENHYFSDETAVYTLTNHFHSDSLDGLGLGDFDCGVTAAGALLRYLYDTQKNDLSHLTHIQPYTTGKYMILDSFTRRNLELTETLREKQKKGSLLWILDRTKTAMGARMLRSFIEQPLIEKEAIELRLDAVDELKRNMIGREEIREYLQPVYDLERLISRIVYKTANPRDLIAFSRSIRMIPHIRTLLSDFESALLRDVLDAMDPLTDLYDRIEAAILEEPPVTVREAGILRDGYNEEVDRLRLARTEGRQWIAQIEEREREKTGIKNLRIKFNKVFGYYLEVTNSYKNLVPDYFIRKQTMANAERYITEELKELEDTILGAQDRLNTLEYQLYCEVRDAIANEVERVQKSAKQIALLDALCSLASVAERNGYVRPKINEKGVINIKEGRHPVVEKMIRGEMFIPNDTLLDQNKNRISIITGPNMAGKSTYMRQNALIVLMAQMGSFVPAKNANIGITDRIFTRVGASDDLASGQSTFMVEMNEVANILKNATKNSLLILDEIGRGTSTMDGLSIAWAVVEYISDPKLIGAKTLFATHYHELTTLEGKLPHVNNYCIAVREQGDDIIFLRKIIPGGADRSYGIQVAKLAGVPQPVIDRAKQICAQLEENHMRPAAAGVEAQIDMTKTRLPVKNEMDLAQMSLMDTVKDSDIIEEIQNLNISQMTPLDALNKIYELQSRINNRW